MLKSLFTDHPCEVGETYAEHMGVAFGFGTAMIAGGLACLVHGLVPGLHKRTGSTVIRRLAHRMGAGRVRPGVDPADHAHGFRDYGLGI